MSKIEVESIGKRYGEGDDALKVMEDVSFEIEENEFVSIIGPSGCGKTTLLKIIDGLVPSSSGEVRIDGARVTSPRPTSAMVFQTFQLLPWRNVVDNVALGLEIQGLEKAERQRVAHEWIETVGLEGFEDSYPWELSGGMKQRVGLARALAIDPEILLMDEPFGALDAQTRDQMQGELLELLEQKRKTIVFVTHDIEEAIFLADRVLVLSSKPATITRELEVDLERPRWNRRVEIIEDDRFDHWMRTLRQDLGLDMSSRSEAAAVD
jgi:NitT/TauT family transport system ATP-binding protein